MPEGAIAGARRQARREDLLALRQLDRVRETAFARGEVRIRQPLASQTDDGSNDGDGQAAEEPIGAEVWTPGPGWGDVGSVRDRGWTQRLEVASVVSRWDEIVGPTVARHCTVEEFAEDGTLTLRTSSTSWETQIRALLATLETTLAEEIGEGVVKRIVVKGPALPNWKHGRFSVPGRGVRDTYD